MASNTASLRLVRSASGLSDDELRRLLEARALTRVPGTAMSVAEAGEDPTPEELADAIASDHAWIDALPVPATIRPSLAAPLRVLVGYLIRQRWRRFAAWVRVRWPFGWRTVLDTGITVYQEHPSGRRRAWQRAGAHQPIDRRWLESGQFSTPRAGLDVSRLQESLSRLGRLGMRCGTVTVGRSERSE